MSQELAAAASVPACLPIDRSILTTHSRQHTHPPFHHPSTTLTHPPTHPPTHPSIHPSVGQSVSQSVSQSVRLFGRPATHTTTCLHHMVIQRLFTAYMHAYIHYVLLAFTHFWRRYATQDDLDLFTATVLTTHSLSFTFPAV